MMTFATLSVIASGVSESPSLRHAFSNATPIARVVSGSKTCDRRYGVIGISSLVVQRARHARPRSNPGSRKSVDRLAAGGPVPRPAHRIGPTQWRGADAREPHEALRRLRCLCRYAQND